jgi:predicted alpha/beta superfamily hydrolase
MEIFPENFISGERFCVYSRNKLEKEILMKNEFTIHYPSGVKSGYFHTYDNLRIDKNDTGRKIHVYLPVNYDKSTESYPVIYMNDGNTTFWANGLGPHSWNVQQTLETLYNEGILKKVIIVAVYPNNREYEYLLVKGHTGIRDFSENGAGGLPQYADYLVGLKKYIDQEYRTVTDGAQTGIIGSSHGGLASFYTAVVHSDSFGCCGAFSPSFWSGAMRSLKDSILIQKITPFLTKNRKPKILITWGLLSYLNPACIVERLSEKRSEEMVEILKNKFQYVQDDDLYVFKDKLGKHDEQAWEYHTKLFLEKFFSKS